MGEGPTFECVWFGLAARSPLLQNYLLTRGLVEEQEGGVGGVLGPVVGRTQISKLPYPLLHNIVWGEYLYIIHRLFCVGL